MIVYKTTNIVNGKFYVGQDSKDNPNYLGSGILLKKAIEKYGKEHFIKETLELCETKEQLNEREIYWITVTNAKEVGYNLAEGGHGGLTYTEETRKRISEQFSGRYVSPETIQKRKDARQKVLEQNPDAYKVSDERRKSIGDSSRGGVCSDETKRKMSLAQIGKTYPSIPWSEERKQNARGRKRSDETKRKMSDSHKGHKMSDDFCENQRQRMLGEGNPMYGRKIPHTEEYKLARKGEGNPFYGCKHSEETKKKISESRKNKTPEQKLEKYIKFYISRTGKEPSEEQKQLKFKEYCEC